MPGSGWTGKWYRDVMRADSDDLALALGGGGARAAYQAGVLKAVDLWPSSFGPSGVVRSSRSTAFPTWSSMDRLSAAQAQ